MGVNRSDYILIGTNLNHISGQFGEDFYESPENDKFLWKRNHKVGELAYLSDNYSDNYFIVGVPIEIDKDGYEGLCVTEFNFNTLNPTHQQYVKMVKEHVKEKFAIDVIPHLIVLTHYT